MKKTVAALAVDPQKGFTPICPDELPVPDGDKIADELNFMLSLADLKTASKDWHPQNALWIANESSPQLSELGLPNADVYWGKHCIGGTEGAEFLDGLPKPEEFDYMVYKGLEPHLHPYSACFHGLANKISTGLIEWYRQNNVEVVLVGGLAYEFCVKQTVMDLREAGFDVALYTPAVRGIFPDLMEKAKEEMLVADVIIDESPEDLQLSVSTAKAAF